ncbi:RNA 2',3'-cyclic phosphodiesterase [Halovenus sp. HT40]|uniref:RNA 2',3'-cyclic phosphodiesterase n=1 Tax=Halovenus sp. HT40 TaxID=3126691 RepID=UPI00300EFC43
MRLFVSADLDGLANEVSAVQSLFEDASGLRTTDPKQAHVTLKFLGDTDPDRLDELTEALEVAVDNASVSPFQAEIGGLGVFPHLDYISVVWVGVRAGSEQLTRLHESIEAATTDIGFDPEDHDFTPHATIARMDHAGGKELVQDVVESRDPDVGTIQFDEIRLIKSELTEEGPEYSIVERFPL